jgi:uncharacterized cofD-like protein
VLVPGIAKAILNSPATKIFICNLMTQANESVGLSAADHIAVLHRHAGGHIFDYVMVNESAPSCELAEKYAAEGAAAIAVNVARIRDLGVEPVAGAYLLEYAGVARHDTARVAHDLLQLALRTSPAESVPAVAA